MSAVSPPPFSVLVLAGGRGQRMGGHDKGLLAWHGQPLIAHLQRLLRPLSDDLIISCNRNQALYRSYADQLVGDLEPDFPGPLAGVRAGLRVARHEWLLILACDAPLVDRALIEQLLNLAQTTQAPAMVRQAGFWQPMFSLIPRRLAAPLEQRWQAGERSLQRALRDENLQALDCAEDDRRLSNFNTPEGLR
ncbi:molybdenum cofactor guanylyltransferase MobA [Pseudomonas sp. SDI]|uniref:molybdenum cofactor guanylyltransferase MobA n=1 Tax=Pseudomonas sp. SDI TaxID=2170734 RepID=UPI000DE637BF|nr:molybdenum cofactor guanylyltransferase MobA [Pseudomonas sp. SDI]PWB29308.1 molybdenum cofactor guanylyltransferase MobA [Pseudomonas sp. SDI]